MLTSQSGASLAVLGKELALIKFNVMASRQGTTLELRTALHFSLHSADQQQVLRPCMAACPPTRARGVVPRAHQSHLSEQRFYERPHWPPAAHDPPEPSARQATWQRLASSRKRPQGLLASRKPSCRKVRHVRWSSQESSFQDNVKDCGEPS